MRLTGVSPLLDFAMGDAIHTARRALVVGGVLSRKAGSGVL
jgi:hypothetical protein